ncbi:hypothetical protein Naga_101519g3, partial [Nannochloropsis gaditana]
MQEAAGVVSPSSSSTSTSSSPSSLRLTFLESNSWLWEIPLPPSSLPPSLPPPSLTLLVDPVMHDLTFGAPALIRGKKKVLNGPAVMESLAPRVDHLLISQGFDDHCQPASIAMAARLLPPSAHIVAPQSASKVLETFFSPERIHYLSPGEHCYLEKRREGGRDGGRVKVTATTGDTLGPPWQAPENGYLLEWGEKGGREEGEEPRSLYYEPHCRFKVEEFEVREG